MKKKIKPNQNLICILDYIKSADQEITWIELIQFALDYEVYEELYLNYMLIDKVVNCKNQEIKQNNLKKVEVKRVV